MGEDWYEEITAIRRGGGIMVLMTLGGVRIGGQGGEQPLVGRKKERKAGELEKEIRSR